MKITGVVLALALASATLRQRTSGLLLANSLVGAYYMLAERQAVAEQLRATFRLARPPFALADAINVLSHAVLPAVVLARTARSAPDVRTEAMLLALYVLAVDVRQEYWVRRAPIWLYIGLYGLVWSGGSLARGAAPSPVLLATAGVVAVLLAAELRRARNASASDTMRSVAGSGRSASSIDASTTGP